MSLSVESPTPDDVTVPRPVLDRFNALLDEMTLAEQAVARANDDLYSAKKAMQERQSELAQVFAAVRLVAHEIRHGLPALPLFADVPQ